MDGATGYDEITAEAGLLLSAINNLVADEKYSAERPSPGRHQ